MRGNCVMKGYLKNPAATEAAFAGGWFHSGDLAVQHPDGHIQIVDRAKDIIISGGENVSSVEVEGVLMHHPAVSLAAVVAKPDDNWGEVPCAFVELREGAERRRGRHHRLRPRPPRRLQDAQARRLRRAAQDLDRQDPEVPPARAGALAVRRGHPVTALHRYQRLEAEGVWRATPDARRQEVIVVLGDATLVIHDRGERPLAHWSLPAVERHGTALPRRLRPRPRGGGGARDRRPRDGRRHRDDPRRGRAAAGAARGAARRGSSARCSPRSWPPPRSGCPTR